MFAQESFIPFTQELYRQFVESDCKENFFVSPLSIYSALSLVLAGAESESKKELISTLHVEHGKDMNELTKTLGDNLHAITEGDEKKTLLQANGVFVQSGGHLEDAFKNIVSKYFRAVSKELDFENDPETARGTINKWISTNTKEKIKDLLSEGSITSLTRLVLANAVYFKGSWKAKFDKNQTDENGIFHTLTGGDTKVCMMHRKAKYPVTHFIDLEARGLKIPFECHEMLVVLPEKKDGLPGLLKKLSEDAKCLKEILTSEYIESEVILRFPKFTLGGKCIQLKEKLEKMGLESIFDGRRADFSGITGDRSLVVSDVYHQAVIEVDEEGAEAAAATAAVMMARCMPMPPPEFRVDHPFLFFIVSNSGIPLFMGHVVEPLLI